ncbi:SprT-like domain-containing protein [Halobacillus ihumii]|uniref:SprT-like domain-containing protein n=1 Tax=Halobacillus ihumii TaxID=2686092 RepID=UPI001F07B57E|nr:SprT-like domain-containing protein [Halobacillus ihumii]
MMNGKQLFEAAEKFLFDNFGMAIEVPIEINKRLKSTFGYFQFSGNQPKKISMSYEFVKNQPNKIVLDVLYHECVHYALFMQGKPFHDGDVTFKRTVDRLGVSRTGTYRFKGVGHLYRCKNDVCGKKFTKKMKGYDKRYICAKCKSRFEYLGEVEI